MKKLISIYDKTKKVDSLNSNGYKFDGFVKSDDFLFLSGFKSKIIEIDNLIPQTFEKGDLINQFNFFLMPNKKQILAKKDNSLVFWDKENGEKTKKMQKDIGKLVSVINNKFMLFDDKPSYKHKDKLILYDVKKDKVLSFFTPKFSSKETTYFAPTLTTLYFDGENLFIASSIGIIEHWILDDGFFTSAKFNYKKSFKMKNTREANKMLTHPKDKNTLIVCGKNNFIDFVNKSDGKTIKTYKADRNIWCNDVAFSDDGKFMVASGGDIFIWESDKQNQYDMLLGEESWGVIFLKNSHKFMIGNKNIDIWEIK